MDHVSVLGKAGYKGYVLAEQRADSKPQEVVLRIQGILVESMLPPVLTYPRFVFPYMT